MLQAFKTMSQQCYCNADLRKKSSLRIVPCNITLSLLLFCGSRCRRRRRCLRSCYTRQLAATIFSATQGCIIVATLFRMVVTLFQYCIAVLRKKSSLRIVPCNITFKLPSLTTKAKAYIQKSFTSRTRYKGTPSGKWFLDPYLIIESCDMDEILCSRHSNETTSSFGSTVMFFYIQ